MRSVSTRSSSMRRSASALGIANTPSRPSQSPSNRGHSAASKRSGARAPRDPTHEHMAKTLYEEQLLPVCSPALLAARGQPDGPAELDGWPLLYDLGWDTDWAYWSACQHQPAPDLSRASGFRLYSMLVDAAGQGLGAAIGRPALIARELASGMLVPVLDQQADAPERCCLITTAGSRRKPEVQAFRQWILRQAQSAAHPTRAR